jgi:hypothetical protein
MTAKKIKYVVHFYAQLIVRAIIVNAMEYYSLNCGWMGIIFNIILQQYIFSTRQDGGNYSERTYTSFHSLSSYKHIYWYKHYR